MGVVVALKPLNKLCQLIGGIGQCAASITNIAGIDADTDSNTDTANSHILRHAWQWRLMMHAMIVHAIMWSLRCWRMAHHMVRRRLRPR